QTPRTLPATATLRHPPRSSGAQPESPGPPWHRWHAAAKGSSNRAMAASVDNSGSLELAQVHAPQAKIGGRSVTHRPWHSLWRSVRSQGLARTFVRWLPIVDLIPRVCAPDDKIKRNPDMANEPIDSTAPMTDEEREELASQLVDRFTLW